MQFCSENACRRKRILQYFQEEVGPKGGSEVQKGKTDPSKCCDFCKVCEVDEWHLEPRVGASQQRNASSIALVDAEFSAEIDGVGEREGLNGRREGGFGVFQTARELFQQRLDGEEEGEGEERRWEKPKIRSGQMYHVNANGEFSDSGGEEEESIADQIRRRIGLGSKVPMEKEKSGAKAAKTMQSTQKTMQSTQKTMQSTLNFNAIPSHSIQNSPKSNSIPSKPTSIPSKPLEYQSVLPIHTPNSASSSLHSSKKQEKTLLHTAIASESFQTKSKSKPSSSSSSEKKLPSSSSEKKLPSSSSTHTHTLPSDKSSSPPSRKRPSPSSSTFETPTKPTLDLTKASDRSMCDSLSILTHRPKKLLQTIVDDVQNLTACLDVSAKQRVKCVEAFFSLESLTSSLQKKYHIALTPYLPSEWVDCIAWQQARLQEHQLIAESRQNEHSQADIRSFFGKSGTASHSEKPGKLLNRYKAAYTKIFGEVAQCGKDGRLPPFVPLNEDINAVNTENLMLTTKCRWSLLPFLSPEALTPILKHVVTLIARQTPKDEGKEEFAKRMHVQVDKAIKLKQPFLLKCDLRVCFIHLLYIVEYKSATTREIQR